MRKEGRVSCHFHDVGIALEAGHKRAFEKGGIEVIPFLALAVACIFAGKDLRAFAVVAVVACALLEEPFFGTVEVLVYEVYLEAFHFGPEVVEFLAFAVRTRRTDYLDFGMFLAQYLDKGCKVLYIFRAPLFVADTEILEVEWRGMTHVGAELAPYGGGVAVGKFNQVYGILDIGLQFVHRHVGFRVAVLELAYKAYVEYGKGGCADFLTQKEVLVETKTVRLIVVGIEAVREGIVPAVEVGGAVFRLAHGIFPLIAVADFGTLYNTSAGEAEYARFEVFEGLYEVGTKAVPVILGEERDMVGFYIVLVGVGKEDTQEAFVDRLVGFELGGIFLPPFRCYFDVGLGIHLGLAHRRRIGKFYADFCRALRSTKPCREKVGGIFMDCHTEEAFVLKSGIFVAVA